MTPEEFKQARLSLGLTRQSDAAALLGYSRQASISDIETGRAPPSPAAVRLLRAYLDGYRPDDWPTSASAAG